MDEVSPSSLRFSDEYFSVIILDLKKKFELIFKVPTLQFSNIYL